MTARSALARGLLVVVAVLSITSCSADDVAVSTPTDNAVARMMDNCVSGVMRGVAGVSAVDTASDAAMNYALRSTLAGCAERDLPAISSEHHCNDGGCYGSDGMGWSWDTRVKSWGCDNLSSSYC